MRATWRHIRANPVEAIAMWLVSFVVFGVVNSVVRAVTDEPVWIGPVLLWPAWMATVETFVLTWYTLRKRAKAARADTASAE